MKVAFITTVNHNVGDDFVREGIKFLLRQRFPECNFTFQNIHKHAPITAREGFDSFRNRRLSKLLDFLIPKHWTKDKISDADIVIQSGAPVYWCHETGGGHCWKTEWFDPLIRERFLMRQNTPLLNLAAGTCQKYYSDGSEFCEKCKNYIKEFYELAKITTVRDELARNVLEKIGLTVPLIPCSSIFAMDEYKIFAQKAEYIALNYMKGGAHYTFGQEIDFYKWESEFRKFYSELKKRERIVLVCHNKAELDAALNFDSKAEVFYKKDDFRAYIEFYSKARFGIMNRVHGAFLIASFGRPSIVIGNDSRAKMAREIGLECAFVNDIDSGFLWKQYELLKTGAEKFSEKFSLIKKRAYNDYMDVLSALSIKC